MNFRIRHNPANISYLSAYQTGRIVKKNVTFLQKSLKKTTTSCDGWCSCFQGPNYEVRSHKRVIILKLLGKLDRLFEL